MIIPVRCITCGRPISSKWEPYNDAVSKGKDAKKVLDELGVKSYCCRNMFITQKELILDISEFKKKFVPKEDDEVVEAKVVIAPVESEPDADVEKTVPEATEDETPLVEEKEEL